MMPDSEVQELAKSLTLPRGGVAAVLRLLSDQATVPFIARYRKEMTGGLDEVQIRAIRDAHSERTEREKRRAYILSAISEQGKLDPALEERIRAATTRAQLEDLYLPFKKKRRTRATIARERGLELLANRILAQPRGAHPDQEAQRFVDPEREVPDAQAALAGARDIVAEEIAQDPDTRAFCRLEYFQTGQVVSTQRKGVSGRTKFEQYYDYREPVSRIPSHRWLAIARGEAEEVLRVRIVADHDRIGARVLRQFAHDRSSAFSGQLEQAVLDSLSRLLGPSLSNEVRSELKGRSDLAAVDVFATNLESLLLAAPMGGRAVVGIDPGIRTGCKCAAVDATGAYKGTITIYPGRGGDRDRAAAEELVRFCRRHRPEAVAVGNGTAGRETHSFARHALSDAGLSDVMVVLTNESGASVYSASDVAREEFPDLDLTVRGAISIARRLQDPLAELVKIEPKAIGVGQYQHDVDQPTLIRKLGAVVETCVNRVGVDLNTASAPLLSFVAGIGPVTARRIVSHRATRGPFRGRRGLLDVGGLGPKTFEQCAGFLRIRDGEQPLDGSAVHPERYGLVERMARDAGLSVGALVGSAQNVDRIELKRYVDGETVGEPTLRDIAEELKKPGRDPRDTFEAPRFRDDVNEIGDLRPGMWLEGVVTNVTHFGAFVDVGVHQDGLVHVSQLADRFVRDPNEVVRAGDRLRVRVVEIDHERRRISLSARKEQAEGPRPPPRPDRHDRAELARARREPSADPKAPLKNRPFAALLQGAKQQQNPRNKKKKKP